MKLIHKATSVFPMIHRIILDNIKQIHLTLKWPLKHNGDQNAMLPLIKQLLFAIKCRVFKIHDCLLNDAPCIAINYISSDADIKNYCKNIVKLILP